MEEFFFSYFNMVHFRFYGVLTSALKGLKVSLYTNRKSYVLIVNLFFCTEFLNTGAVKNLIYCLTPTTISCRWRDFTDGAVAK